MIYELQKFYYDTAQVFNPYTMPSFKKLVPASQILFGTDYPLLTPDRWMADFEKIDIRPEVKPLILKENAVRILRLR